MTTKGKIGAGVLMLAAGAAFGGVGEAPRPSERSAPEVSFQDGRDRNALGDVSAAYTLFGAPVSADPEDYGPFAACFEEGYEATPEEWDSLMAAIAAGYESRYNAVDRWTGTAGAPITLRWSFVPDGTQVPGLSGPTAASNLFARMDTLFGAANRAFWITQFTNSFNRWGALAGIEYTRVTNGTNDWDDGAGWGTGGSTTRGDIRISMRTLDGGSGVLAFNSFPDSGDMVMDSSENWASSANTYRFLRNTIMHEHGHGLGFAHVCPTNGTKLMEPFLNTGFDGPQQDDARGAQWFYGDVLEPNNSASVATDLGTLNAGTTTTLGAVPAPIIASTTVLSIRTGDSDYFKYTLDTPRLVSITATPVGSTYTDLDQNGDGSCQTTPANNTNAMQQADLQITAYASNGTTTWRVQNNNALGANEQIAGLLVNSGLNYFRVHSTGAVSQTQCYNVSITILNANLNCSASDGTFADFVRVSWPSVQLATGYIVMRNTVDSTSTATQVATVDGATTTYDDTSAAPGTQYYYFIRAQQEGSTTYRYMTTTGEPGHRPGANLPPVANAGTDATVTDTDGSGSEIYQLNGSGSTDSDGTIVNYAWTEGATTLFTGGSPTFNASLAVGVHNIVLTVTDNLGATDTDDLVVTVDPEPVACDPDVNCDGVPDQGDVACMILAVAGDMGCFCQADPDFNGDGVPDQGDVADVILVVAGAPCP